MFKYWLKGWRKALVGSCAALLVSAGSSHAQDRDAELRALIEKQGKQRIVALPTELLSQLGWDVGDVLAAEVFEGGI